MKREKLFLLNVTQFDNRMTPVLSQIQQIVKEIQQLTNRINYKQKKKKKKKKKEIRTDILSNAGILTKPTKNLIIIASSSWTRYLLKKIYMGSKHLQ